jgi:hypothetical protein
MLSDQRPSKWQQWDTQQMWAPNPCVPNYCCIPNATKKKSCQQGPPEWLPTGWHLIIDGLELSTEMYFRMRIFSAFPSLTKWTAFVRLFRWILFSSRLRMAPSVKGIEVSQTLDICSWSHAVCRWWRSPCYSSKMNEGTFLLTALDVMIYFALNRMLNTIVSDSQAILFSWKLRLATLIEGIEVSQTSDDYSQSYAVLAQSSQRSIRSRSNTQLNYWFPIT